MGPILGHRLELKQFSMLWRSLPKMVIRVSNVTSARHENGNVMSPDSSHKTIVLYPEFLSNVKTKMV